MSKHKKHNISPEELAQEQAEELTSETAEAPAKTDEPDYRDQYVRSRLG